MRLRFLRKKMVAVQPVWMAKVVARERAIRWQIAERLRRQAARLSPMQLRWMFVLAVSAGLMVYTWIGVRALSDPLKPKGFTVGSFSLRPTGVGRRSPEPRGVFRSPLDSINANPALKKRFDSLRAARPGFADTVRRLEEIYSGH